MMSLIGFSLQSRYGLNLRGSALELQAFGWTAYGSRPELTSHYDTGRWGSRSTTGRQAAAPAALSTERTTRSTRLLSTRCGRRPASVCHWGRFMLESFLS